MEYPKWLACRESSISSVSACTGFISKHSHNSIDMTIDLRDALEVSINDLTARYLFCPNISC
jgi:hypothetical protein